MLANVFFSNFAPEFLFKKHLQTHSADRTKFPLIPATKKRGDMLERRLITLCFGVLKLRNFQ